MRIQGAQLPNTQLRGLPTVSGGPMASADMFAPNAAGIGNLGRAVQGFGQEVLRQDQVRRREHDESVARNLTTQLHSDWKNGSGAIFASKGIDAQKAPEMTEKWFDETRKAYDKNLENDHQRKAFDQAFTSFRAQSVDRAVGHRDEQDLIFRDETLDGQNKMIGIEAADSADAALTPEGRAANQGRLSMIFDNVNKRYAGQSEEVKSLKRREAAQVFHKGILDAMRPEEALKYLDEDGVGQALGTAAMRKLRDGYNAIIEKRESDREDAEASLYAMDRLDRGTDLEKLQPELIEKYGLQRGKLAFQEAVTQNNLRNSKQAAEAKAAAEKRWDDFYKTGKVPEGVTYQERRTMLADLNRKAKGQPSDDPWAFGQYLIDNFTPEALKQMQRDGKWGEIYPKLLYNGKQTDIYKDVADYMNGVKGTVSPEKYARMQFTAITGVRPGTKEGAQSFNQFMGLFNEEAEKRAGELKLDHVNMLPREEQEKIITNLLEVGAWGYSWQPNFLSHEKYRYEVMGKSNYQEYFYPKPESAQPYRKTISRSPVSPPSSPASLSRTTSDGALSTPTAPPSSSAAGPRDSVAATPRGVEITTNQGVKQRVEGNRILVNHPRETETKQPAAPPEPAERPAEVERYLAIPGAKSFWNGEEWILTVPSVGMIILDANGQQIG